MLYQKNISVSSLAIVSDRSSRTLLIQQFLAQQHFKCHKGIVLFLKEAGLTATAEIICSACYNLERNSEKHIIQVQYTLHSHLVNM